VKVIDKYGFMSFIRPFYVKKFKREEGKMALKKFGIIALVTIMVMVLFVGSAIPVAGGDTGLLSGQIEETYIDCNNSTWSINRTFEYYIPNSYTGSTSVPLLFSFHGLGSTGIAQIDLTKFDVLAEREGFIAVFPDATAIDSSYPGYVDWIAYIAAHNWTLPALTGSNIMWNCGDITGIPIAPLQYVAGVDDVGFTSDMVDWFKDNYNINTSHIYSTGMSNGAMFSYLLAFNLSGTFAGIAPVTGVMDLNLGWNATTPDPLTVIAMRGDSDPVIPEAGECSSLPMCNNFGYSTPDTIAYWCEVDGINMTSPGPTETVFGPTAADPTVVHRYVYSGGTGGTQVILFWIEGAGHTWPGGPQYTDLGIIGSVTNHIDGSGQIWKYLPPVPKYYLRICSTSDGSINTFGETHHGGSVTTPGEGSFFYYPGSGDHVVNLVAEPLNEYYEFVNWTSNDVSFANPTAPTTTITITPNKDYEIKANFQLKSAEPPSGGCFIATAAYGTPTAKQLDVLREFRDSVLLKSTVGSRLVDLYYQMSPPVADFISENSFVRTLVRELLVDPAVWVVEATGNIWRN
jgi:polyhydroxybutyrate depolymerase